MENADTAVVTFTERGRMIHPLFKCYGSKFLSSKTLPEPRYTTIIEPFAGGAGYSLRHHEHKVVLYERDEQVAELWRWLIEEATESDIRDIPVGLPVGTDILTVGLSSGQCLLLKFWQRTNNVGNCFTISKWGHLPGQFTANTRARVAEEVGAIKHWVFGGTDAFGAFDSREATWFVDPPYLYNYAYRQPPISYFDLKMCCLLVRGQVIACEAECPKTGKIPDYLPFKPWAKRVTSRRAAGNHTHSSELLWTNDNGMLEPKE